MKAVLTVIAALCLAGCTRKRRFPVRALVERSGALQAGDEIGVVYRDGDREQLVVTGLSGDTLHTETRAVLLADLDAIDAERIAVGRLLGRACAIVAAGAGLLALLRAVSGA